MALIAFLLLAVMMGAVPFALGILVDHVRPAWSHWRKVMAAALPLPLVLGLASAALEIRSYTASEQACGKDLCGLMAMLGLGGLVLTVIVLVIALAMAHVAMPKR